MAVFNMIKPPYIPEICTWDGGTDAQIKAMIQAADKGDISLAKYWSVGDEREVQLSAMKDPYDVNIPTQTITLKLVNVGGMDLQTPIDKKTQCSFVWCLSNLLSGISTSMLGSNGTGWSGCGVRTWCNTTFFEALPQYLQDSIKYVNNPTAVSVSDNYAVAGDCYDRIAVPSYTQLGLEKRFYGCEEGKAWSYYTNDALRSQGESYYSRTTVPDTSTTLRDGFLCVTSTGAADSGTSSGKYPLLVFGCI